MSSSTAAPTASLGERKKSAPAVPPIVTQQPPSAEASSEEDDDDEDDEDENDNVGTSVELGAQNAANNQRSRSQSIQLAQKGKFGSKGALHSPVGSAHSFDLQVRQLDANLGKMNESRGICLLCLCVCVFVCALPYHAASALHLSLSTWMLSLL